MEETVKGSDEYQITNFTESQGLTNSNVNSIFEDRLGNIWFGTRFGLYKIDKEKCDAMGIQNNANKLVDYSTFFNRYQYEDGLLGVGVNIGNTITQDRDGDVWIGADDRITVYHPEALSRDTVVPIIQLTALELFNESITWPQLAQNKDTAFVLRNGIRFARCSFSDVSRWYLFLMHIRCGGALS